MKKLILIFSLIVVAVVMSACSPLKEKWYGVYYPGGNVDKASFSPVLSSSEDCVDWAEEIRRGRPEDEEVSPGHLYECAKGCVIEYWAGERVNTNCEEGFDDADI